MRIYLIIILFLSTKCLFGQGLPNLDSIVISLKRTNFLGEKWEISKQSDTVLVVSCNKQLKLSLRQLKSEKAHDTLQYKLLIIFRAESKQPEQYISAFKALMKKFKTFNEQTRSYNFNFDTFFKDKWGELLPYTIPPTIIFPNYSIVFIDNFPAISSFTIKPFEDFNEIENNLWYLIHLFGEEGIFFPLKKYMSEDIQFNIIGIFGLIDWGGIKEINYPQLFIKE